MSIAVVTGAAGLIGGEAVRFFGARGLDVVGIDNDMRRVFFGAEASTAWNRRRLEQEVPGYRHVDADIRDGAAMGDVFARFGKDIAVIIHAAAQPSHDWAAREPLTDFSVNALATLQLLELTRQHAPDAVFIFISTNKVYGDQPNHLPLVEGETRYELSPEHPWAAHGFDESMSIDHTLHSLFGVSKASADLMVQEYGRYFGMRTACFRGGCLTGPAHSGTELHGFLSYLVRASIAETPYTVFGHKAKQVRDNIHAYDLVNALWHVYEAPRSGEVYNIGGGRHSNCSMIEAIARCEALNGRPMAWRYADQARVGDHIWWISDCRRFQAHYPGWTWTRSIDDIIAEIHAELVDRLPSGGAA